MTIELTDLECQQLNFALGVAAGAGGNVYLTQLCLHLSNVINRNNPNWTPYKVELTAPC